MPVMDTAARGALESPVLSSALVVYLDILGEPVRFTTFRQDTLFSATGDADLDGHTYIAMSARALDISDIRNGTDGSGTRTVDISGIMPIDQVILNTLGNPANWRGRIARTWFQLYSPGNAPVGAIVPDYTGYMSALSIIPGPDVQVIRISLENYLAAFNEPSKRSYLDQQRFDPGDVSAGATIASANGARPSGHAPVMGSRTGSSFGEIGVVHLL